jgi:hypothetical protein
MLLSGITFLAVLRKNQDKVVAGRRGGARPCRGSKGDVQTGTGTSSGEQAGGEDLN